MLFEGDQEAVSPAIPDNNRTSDLKDAYLFFW